MSRFQFFQLCVTLFSVFLLGNASASSYTVTEVADIPANALEQYLTTEYEIEPGTIEVNYGIKFYRVVYNAGLILGTPGNVTLNMSAMVMVPTMSEKPVKEKVDAFFSFHGTILVAQEVPSNMFSSGELDPENGEYSIFSGIVATGSMGHISMLPDGIGHGDSSEQPYHYLIPDAYAISGFNLHEAVKLYLADNENLPNLSGNLIISGYSEGGYATMAFHDRAQHEVWAKGAEVNVLSSHPAAGPYDLGGVQLEIGAGHVNDRLDKDEEGGEVILFAMVGYAYEHYYGIEDIFNESHREDVDRWFKGDLRIELLLFDIAVKLGYNHTVLFSESLQNALFFDGKHPLVERMKINSVADSWFPGSNSYMQLCHGTSDEVVYYENTEIFMSRKLDNVTVSTKRKCDGHGGCGNECLFQLFDELAGGPSRSDPIESKEFLEEPGGIAAVTVGAVAVVIIFAAIIISMNKKRANYQTIRG